MPQISGGGITVVFDVTLTEKVTRGGKLTSSPIEGDKTISDHFSKNPDTMSISGVCTTDGANKIANLTKLFSQGILCRYEGRNLADNVVITKFDTDHGGDYAGGFGFTMTLSYVLISSSEEYTYSTGMTNSQNVAQVQTQSNIGTISPTEVQVDSATTAAANEKASSLIQTYN